MSLDTDSSTSRVPTLVQYSQRVLASHIDIYAGLGDVRYELIEPILEGCSADTLLRLEEASPRIAEDTCDLWKQLCFKSYPLVKERLSSGELEEPESWRDLFFRLRQMEANRLEELATRLRSQRQEAEERKKESAVKLTDRVPPSKRSRSSWSSNAQPKTLFQKTRSEASKLQRSMYSARVFPPMHQGKTFRVLAGSPSVKPVASASASSGTNGAVTVKTVSYRRPSSLDHRPLSRPAKHTTSSKSTVSSVTTSEKPPPSAPPQSSPPPSSDYRPIKFPSASKRDPMASMFMPKHRAHSQLENKASPTRSIPVR